MSGFITTFLTPSQNSADNNDIADVVGNKTDDENGDSLYSVTYRAEKHIHTVSKLYPSLAAGVVVTAGAGAWTLGNFATIVPASTITFPFDIHFINVTAISANDSYHLRLYYGASDTECANVAIVRNAIQSGTYAIPTISTYMAANSQIRAKLASASGSNNVTIKIGYHEY